jgi:mannosyl-3-phosphoglycerate phosphatase
VGGACYIEVVLLVFTDMDGCLLDHNTYEWAPAQPALKALERMGAKVILTTSKTRAEVERWQKTLGLHDPFIVENGGAVVAEPSSLPEVPHNAQIDHGKLVWTFGWPHAQIIHALYRAATESRCEIRGFSDMTVEEVASHTNMAVEEAHLACVRQYSEPFLLLTPKREPALLRSFLVHGLKVTRGGRFFHAQRHTGKGEAVARLVDLYDQGREDVVTIGLGDGLNDESFLRIVDYPVILQSSHAEELSRRVPHARLTPTAGPAAWGAAVFEILKEIEDNDGSAA